MFLTGSNLFMHSIKKCQGSQIRGLVDAKHVVGMGLNTRSSW